MLLYATFLGYSSLSSYLQANLPGPDGNLLPPTHHWTLTDPPMTWSHYFTLLGISVGDNIRIGFVTLLCLMSFPLSTGLLTYHLYLIWAGTTTNESQKWADLRDDINWGIVWKARREDLLSDYPLVEPNLEPRELDLDPKWRGDKTITRDPRNGEGPNNGIWIVRLRAKNDVVRLWRAKPVPSPPPPSTTSLNPSTSTTTTTTTTNTTAPSSMGPEQTASLPEMEAGDPDERWTRVESLEEIVNVYDLGGWDNFRDVVFNRG